MPQTKGFFNSFFSLLSSFPDLHFIPICYNSKKPDIEGSWLDIYLSKEAVEHRFEEGKNAALVFHNDQNSLYVVDIDTDELTQEEVDELKNKFLEIANTLVVQTPSGGYHLYYLSPKKDMINNAIYYYNGKRAGEIRAKNQYVLIPGSQVNGNYYNVVNATTPAILNINLVPFIQIKRSNVQVDTLKDEQDDTLLSYKIPQTAWTLKDVLEIDGKLKGLISIDPNLPKEKFPIKVLDTEYPSQSEIDLAILSLLAWYGIPKDDAIAILKSFRYRNKLDRADYLERTWLKAQNKFQGAFEIYDPQAPLILDISKISVSKDRPVWKELIEKLPDDHFIKKYLSVATKMTDAYPEYHLISSLFALTVATGYNVILDKYKEDIRLYLIAIGKPAISHKSTAISRILGREILGKSFLSDLRAPVEFSPEGLINALDKNPRLYFIYDEISKLFKLMHKNYASDTEELFLQFFNTGSYRKTLAKKDIKLENPWISFIGATTPSAFENSFDEGRVMSGLFSRILFVYPQYEKKEMPTPNFNFEDELHELREYLNQLYQELEFFREKMNTSLKAVFEEDSDKIVFSWVKRKEKEILGRYNNSLYEDALLNLLSRYQEYIFRLATIVALGKPETLKRIQIINDQLKRGNTENALSNFIDPYFIFVRRDDILFAIDLMNKLFFRYAKMLLEKVLGLSDSSVERVYSILLEAKKITRSELLRRSHLKKAEFEQVIETLKERGDIIEGKEGRTTFYILKSALQQINEGDEEDGQ